MSKYKKLKVVFEPTTSIFSEVEANIHLAQLMIQAITIGLRIDKQQNNYSTISKEKTDEKSM